MVLGQTRLSHMCGLSSFPSRAVVGCGGMSAGAGLGKTTCCRVGAVNCHCPEGFTDLPFATFNEVDW